jgi:cytochrome o ubiquinol oxidase operon protein cyoD
MNKAIVSHHQPGHGTVKSYTLAFIFSLGLTFIAYWLVVKHVGSGWWLMYWLSILAVLQLFVQLFGFLHLGQERKPRWNLTALLFAAMVVIIVVFGSLWIMQHLAYDHAHGSGKHTDSAIIHDEGYSPSAY